MECLQCKHELKDENILANIVNISPVEQISLNVICPECGLIHYRFIDVSDLTWTRGNG